MDNLVSACENGVPLTRTSSDPNLNKHCQEDRPAFEPVPGVGGAVADSPEEAVAETEGCSEGPRVEAVTQAPPTDLEEEGLSESCITLKEPCLTTQPLPSRDWTSPLEGTGPAPILPLAPPLENGHASLFSLPSQGLEADSRTADRTPSPIADAHILAVCNGPPAISRDRPTAVELLTFKNLSPAPPAEDSKETPAEQRAKPPLPNGACAGEEEEREVEEDEEAEEKDAAEGRVGHAQPDGGRTLRRLVCQSQLSEFTLLGSNWESMQGLVQSACGALQPGSQGRRLAGRLLRAQGMAPSGQCCRRESARPACSPVQASWLSTVRSSALCSSRLLAAPPSSPPPPPAPAYLDDDGLPVPMDAVQQRLRQIEAGYKQEVEVLRRQVRQLQMRLESKQYCTPPSEPDVDYEDDIVSDPHLTKADESQKEIEIL